MLVNPETGMPIDRPEATFAGETGMNMLDRMGYNPEQIPLAYDVLGTIPGAATTTMWNMNRVSNTILGGGANPNSMRGPFRYARDSIRGSLNALQTRIPRMPTPRTGFTIPGAAGQISEGIGQTANPARFFRFTRAANIDPAPGTNFYSPFGFMSRAGNSAFRAVAGRGSNLTVANRYLGMGQDLNVVDDAFSRGTFGRMATMARMNSMSGARFTARTPNIAAAVADIRPGLNNRLSNVMGGRWMQGLDDGARALATRGAYTGAIGSSITGQVSGRVAGYFAGAQSVRLGTTEGLMRMSTGAFRIGAERAVGSYATSSLAKFAGSRSASMALRAAGPIGTVMLVRDLAMIGGKLIGAGARTIADAGRSMVAPLNKGVMGNTFRDNSVAATSRQRGVMAIANSRLNMRSVLGHEAAGMAAYYG